VPSSCLLGSRGFFVRLLADYISIIFARGTDIRRRDVTTFLWHLIFLLEITRQLLENTAAAAAVGAGAAAFPKIAFSFADKPSHKEEAGPEQRQTDQGGHAEVEQKDVALASVLLERHGGGKGASEPEIRCEAMKYTQECSERSYNRENDMLALK